MVSAIRPSQRLGNIPPQSIAERIEILKPFADCINENLDFGVIAAWEVCGFDAWSEATKQALGNPQDPYYPCFSRGVLHLVKILKPADRINLICDDDEETAWLCYGHYRALRRAEKRVKRKTISLTFGDDRHLPALQAADMVALLTRLEAIYRFYKQDFDFSPLFDYLVTRRAPPSAQWYSCFAPRARLKTVSDAWEMGSANKTRVQENRSEDGLNGDIDCLKSSF